MKNNLKLVPKEVKHTLQNPADSVMTRMETFLVKEYLYYIFFCIFNSFQLANMIAWNRVRIISSDLRGK
jgi:hypothetical protein